MNSAHGLYIHIPFCKQKCPYCDFYSSEKNLSEIDEYASAAVRQIKNEDKKWDSVFFGGGTPSLLNENQFQRLFNAFKNNLEKGAEITAELNPKDISPYYAKALYEMGINRISLGVQSLNDETLKFLGRRHTAEEAIKAVESIKEAGFDNISVDFMLGIPHQSDKDILNEIAFLKEYDIPHVSAYILKVEKGTPFFKNGVAKMLDEDDVADKYLLFGEKAESIGIMQYEISNFAKLGMESRHNLKYWRSEPYIGIGPAAHSQSDGKRFYIKPSLKDYIEKINNGISPYSGHIKSGEYKEYAMLKLRLSEGLDLKTAGKNAEEIRKKAERFLSLDLIEINGDILKLTRKGFLLSNTIISSLFF